jgi:cbb3-type cytochrome oxidase maturation protein
MNVLYFLVPLALILAAIGVGAFIWSVRSGQFEDVETPGMRVLFDEEQTRTASSHGMGHHAHNARATQDGVESKKNDQPS